MKGVVLTTLPGWQIGLLFLKCGSSLSFCPLFVLKMQTLLGGAQITKAAEVGMDPFFRKLKS